MRCNDIQNLLIEFLDGAIDDGDRRRVIDAHLAECKMCSQQFTALHTTINLARSVDPAVFPKEQFWVNYLPEIRARIAERCRMRHYIPVWVGGTAIAVMVLFVGIRAVLLKTMTSSQGDTVQVASIPGDTVTVKRFQPIRGSTGDTAMARTARNENIESPIATRRGMAVGSSPDIAESKSSLDTPSPHIAHTGSLSDESSPDIAGDLIATESSDSELFEEEFQDMEPALEAYQIEYGDPDRLIDNLSTEEQEELSEQVSERMNS